MIEPLQVPGFGFNYLDEHLFRVGRLARIGLRQRRIGRFRFLMKALENLRRRIEIARGVPSDNGRAACPEPCGTW